MLDFKVVSIAVLTRNVYFEVKLFKVVIVLSYSTCCRLTEMKVLMLMLVQQWLMLNLFWQQVCADCL